MLGNVNNRAGARKKTSKNARKRDEVPGGRKGQTADNNSLLCPAGERRPSSRGLNNLPVRTSSARVVLPPVRKEDCSRGPCDVVDGPLPHCPPGRQCVRVCMLVWQYGRLPLTSAINLPGVLSNRAHLTWKLSTKRLGLARGIAALPFLDAVERLACSRGTRLPGPEASAIKTT